MRFLGQINIFNTKKAILSNNVYLIGNGISDHPNFWCFDGQDLDRKHALICTRNDSVYLCDLNSDKGTFVNEEIIPALTEIKLSGEALITLRFGNLSASLHIGSSGEESWESSGCGDSHKSDYFSEASSPINTSKTNEKVLPSTIGRPLAALQPSTKPEIKTAALPTNVSTGSANASFSLNVSSNDDSQIIVPETQAVLQKRQSILEEMLTSDDSIIPETQEILLPANIQLRNHFNSKSDFEDNKNKNMAITAVGAEGEGNIGGVDHGDGNGEVHGDSDGALEANGTFKISTQEFNENFDIDGSDSNALLVASDILINMIVDGVGVAVSPPRVDESKSETLQLNWSSESSQKNISAIGEANNNQNTSSVEQQTKNGDELRANACTPDLFLNLENDLGACYDPDLEPTQIFPNKYEAKQQMKAAEPKDAFKLPLVTTTPQMALASDLEQTQIYEPGSFQAAGRNNELSIKPPAPETLNNPKSFGKLRAVNDTATGVQAILHQPQSIFKVPAIQISMSGDGDNGDLELTQIYQPSKMKSIDPKGRKAFKLANDPPKIEVHNESNQDKRTHALHHSVSPGKTMNIYCREIIAEASNICGNQSNVDKTVCVEENILEDETAAEDIMIKTPAFLKKYFSNDLKPQKFAKPALSSDDDDDAADGSDAGGNENDRKYKHLLKNITVGNKREPNDFDSLLANLTGNEVLHEHSPVAAGHSRDALQSSRKPNVPHTKNFDDNNKGMEKEIEKKENKKNKKAQSDENHNDLEKPSASNKQHPGRKHKTASTKDDKYEGNTSYRKRLRASSSREAKNSNLQERKDRDEKHRRGHGRDHDRDHDRGHDRDRDRDHDGKREHHRHSRKQDSARKESDKDKKVSKEKPLDKHQKKEYTKTNRRLRSNSKSESNAPKNVTCSAEVTATAKTTTTAPTPTIAKTTPTATITSNTNTTVSAATGPKAAQPAAKQNAKQSTKEISEGTMGVSAVVLPVRQLRKRSSSLISSSQSSDIDDTKKRLRSIYEESADNSVPKMDGVSKSKTSLKIAVTMLSRDMQAKLQNEAEYNLWTLTNEPRECDVLIMDSGSRTFKFLLAVVRGIPIVRSEWLAYYRKTRNMSSVKKFLLRDAGLEKRHNFVLNDSLEKAKQRRVFAECDFFVTSNIEPKPIETKVLLLHGGGKVHDNDEQLPTECQRIYLITSEKDRTQWHKYRRVNKNLRITTTEGVMSAIMRQDAKMLDQFSLGR